MPTYVYECSQCEKTFEIEQRITESPLQQCLCGSEGTVKRIIQPTAVMFKGSGFYVNDSASNANSKKESSSNETSTSETPSTTPSHSEATPH